MSRNMLDVWNEIKTIVDATEADVLKNAKGNASAGVRARHGLRLLSRTSGELVKITLENDRGKSPSDEDDK